MTNEQYISNVLKTESPVTPEMQARVADEFFLRLNHAADGLCTEAGEILDALKKHKYYGKPLDKVNLIEEAGDALWYIAILLDVLDVSFERVMQTNIDKLKTRYPNKFSSDNAINRNLEAERKVLEK